MRAQWKGFLQFEGVSCYVARHTAASTSDRIAFVTINRSAGSRVKREYVNVETGEPVERRAELEQTVDYAIQLLLEDARFIGWTAAEFLTAVLDIADIRPATLDEQSQLDIPHTDGTA